MLSMSVYGELWLLLLTSSSVAGGGGVGSIHPEDVLLLRFVGSILLPIISPIGVNLNLFSMESSLTLNAQFKCRSGSSFLSSSRRLCWVRVLGRVFSGWGRVKDRNSIKCHLNSMTNEFNSIFLSHSLFSQIQRLFSDFIRINGHKDTEQRRDS